MSIIVIKVLGFIGQYRNSKKNSNIIEFHTSICEVSNLTYIYKHYRFPYLLFWVLQVPN